MNPSGSPIVMIIKFKKSVSEQAAKQPAMETDLICKSRIQALAYDEKSILGQKQAPGQ